MASGTDDERQFSWYELMTTDVKGAEKFYTALNAWGLEPFNAIGNEPYEMWTRAGTPFGGVMRLPDEARKMGAPPHWLAYVDVPNVDAAVSRATSLGAKVYVPGTDIPGSGGRFAVLADPQGAVFGVVSSAQPMQEPTGPAPVGAVSWHELMTTDNVAAFSFYNKLFGWEKGEAADMGPMGIYQMFGRLGRPLGGMFNRPPEMAAVPPHWLLYFRVPDVDKAADRVKQLGGKIINGPMDVPGGDRVVVCSDPQGVAFALHQVKSA